MQKNINNKSNRLINEKNPYLLQHAYNPVDWYPWCEEAFERAKKEDKPVFLSIGYSTCHWCHVMAHESFEDDEVAEMMNNVFINIKVDREERPDIDTIYMQVCQMITGSGGWPLTVIMTPEKKPFFAGTYFPKESVINRIGMKDLIKRVDELWRTNRDDILISADEMVKKISQVQIKKSYENHEEIFQMTNQMLDNSFDEIFGGFGDSPKFPIPHNLFYLMNYHYFYNDLKSSNMFEKTLFMMGMGGIYDQIGFGFHRYSTDRQWLVPHFEKMLYDQALLIKAYSIAWQIRGIEYFKNKVYEIIVYVSRELLSDNGGFFSAEDADSEGVEGKFYLWTADELKEILKEDYDFFKQLFCVQDEGNFRDERTGKFTGQNILHLNEDFFLKNIDLKLTDKDLVSKASSFLKKLFKEREKRVHPFKDTKILTDWNGLMLESLALAGRIFKEKRFVEMAKNNFDFIFSNLIKDEYLLHSYNSNIFGNLDDYAFVCAGLIELYNSTFEVKYLEEAGKFQNILNDHFWDKERGGYFMTSDFSEHLLIRRKEIYDGAIPSGNSVQLINLIKLYRITGDVKYKNYIDKLIEYFSGIVKEYPVAYTQYLCGTLLYKNLSFEIVFVVEKIEDINLFLDELNDKFLPNLIIIVKTDANSRELEKIASYTKDMIMVDDKPTMYFCSDYKCENPINDLALIKERLQKL